MKTNLFKRGSVIGTALRPVITIALAGSLAYGSHLYVVQSHALDKAKDKIVQHESSLKHQKSIITGLEKDKADLESKNDSLLKDNATLNQQLKSDADNKAQLEQKLKQTELELQELKK
ncbi:TPA: hypothetical protein QC364_000753 [Bacillus cereus]|uniref:hypothetical protein n=1 Tax=Bacillus paranthracis TaxID=2026186 RepID=UPI002D78553F|nr:hypothetical protein [Bacillus paranthracis]HDR8453961.1 hypothetical protein [Bacillus cereus]